MSETDDGLDFNPVRSMIADWQTEGLILRDIRTTVFIEEQKVPAELEWDEEDSTSVHFLAFVDNEPVACARLTPDGQLGRMAVLKPHRRNGVGSALMRFILLESPKLGFSSLFLHAQTEAIPFYKNFEFQTEGDIFVEANIDHQRMGRMLPPDRSHIASGSDIIRLESMEAFREQSLLLAENARHKLAIFSDHLDPALYNHEDFTSAVLTLTKRSRFNKVRILVRETKPLLDCGHRLLRLYQRSNGQIDIRKLTINPNQNIHEFLLSDDCGIVHRQDEKYYRGISYLEHRGRVKQELEAFDEMWNRAATDPELKRLTV